MKEYFTESNKMKKLGIIVLICGLIIGLCIIIITGICDNNAKKRQKNNLFNHIVDKIDNYSDSYLNSYSGDSIYNDVNDWKNDTTNILRGTSNAFGNAYLKMKYTPFYFTGGLIIFISVGGFITLFVLAKVKDDKLNK